MAKKPAKKNDKPVAVKADVKPANKKAAAPVVAEKATKKSAPLPAKKVEKAMPAPVVEKAAPKAAKKNGNPHIEQLDKILEAELSGVVRYLHYSFMIFGPNRIPITKWFRDQASEGMTHAVLVGEKITALGGHPSVTVQPVPESNKHNVIDLLKESLKFERETIELYKNLLTTIENDIAFEEMVRGLIAEEIAHIEEVEKMCRTPKG